MYAHLFNLQQLRTIYQLLQSICTNGHGKRDRGLVDSIYCKRRPSGSVIPSPDNLNGRWCAPSPIPKPTFPQESLPNLHLRRFETLYQFSPKKKVPQNVHGFSM